MPANFTLADTAADFARAVMERVAAIRAGDWERIDGAAFMAEQRIALVEGLARGLAAALA